jgi:hypothetical protein
MTPKSIYLNRIIDCINRKQISLSPLPCPYNLHPLHGRQAGTTPLLLTGAANKYTFYISKNLYNITAKN